MNTLKKTPSEGGSGGKRGHSNMEHWVYTDEIKAAARLKRRQDDESTTQQGLEEFAEASKSEE